MAIAANRRIDVLRDGDRPDVRTLRVETFMAGVTTVDTP
jgi:hypothetical protein